LSEINKTLRIYLENLISNISPDDSRALIEKESARLKHIEFETEVEHNPLFRMIVHNFNVPLEKLCDILKSSKTFEEFLTLAAQNMRLDDADWVSRLLEKDPSARAFLNQARLILDMPPFNFQEPLPRDNDKPPTKRRVVEKPRVEPKAAE
jgi:hypothetical protein